MRNYRFISVIVALLLSLVSLSGQTVFSLKGTVTDSLGTNHVEATKPDASFCGRFDGVEGGKHRKNQVAYYVLLELNSDHTCSLNKTLDLSGYMGRGEWTMRDDGVIELRFNKNPVLSDIEKALMSGGLIEGTLEIQVLSKNKLKMGDTVLKRMK